MSGSNTPNSATAGAVALLQDAIASDPTWWTAWGDGAGSFSNVLAAGMTFASGPNGQRFGEALPGGPAPSPVAGEGLQAYLDRVTGLSWHDGVPGGGLQALAEEAGGALTHAVLGVVAGLADDIAPGSGNGIRSVDAQIQSGLAANEANLTAGGGSDAPTPPSWWQTHPANAEPIAPAMHDTAGSVSRISGAAAASAASRLAAAARVGAFLAASTPGGAASSRPAPLSTPLKVAFGAAAAGLLYLVLRHP
jgi:hypothetical protein